MEKISDLLDVQQGVSKKQPQILAGGTVDLEATRKMMLNVNKVFTTLHISYPAWYEKYYPSKKSEQLAKRIWLTGIRSLTQQQVDKGLQRMVLEYTFPPKLKEFITLCKRVDGLVSLDMAWEEALLGRYSHEVVKTAAYLTGINELKQASHDNSGLKKRFEFYFNQVSENFVKNRPLDEVSQLKQAKADELLNKIEFQAEERVKARIKLQGIDTQNARKSCLALLGIRHSN